MKLCYDNIKIRLFFAGWAGEQAIERLVGVGPLDGGILPEPGQLSFGIVTGIRRDIGDSLVERAGAVEIVEEFLIADRLQGFMRTPG